METSLKTGFAQTSLAAKKICVTQHFTGAAAPPPPPPPPPPPQPVHLWRRSHKRYQNAVFT